ncbi:MAG: efflux RND transporter periplasmic adaptor subunit, partial [Terriglobia bacterium]
VWVVLVVGGLAAGALYYRSQERAVLAVQTVRAERQEIHTGIVTNGMAEPIVYQDARAEIEGEVSQVLVRAGDSVRRGQKLAELSQRQIASEIESARATLADAENELRLRRQGGTALELRELRAEREAVQREREQAAKLTAENERLVERGAIARIELDQSRQRLAKADADLALLDQKLSGRYVPEEMARAEARVEAARAALELAQSRLRSTAVLSPLAGVVYSLPARPGDYVRSGDLLARVGELGRIRVKMFVDEPDLGRVAAGQAVVLRWEGLPGREWRGQVEQLPAEIKELNSRRVGEVTCTLDNPKGELLPNMNLDVEILIETRDNALVVPRETVFGTGSARHVFVVRDGVLARRAVEIGLISSTRTEITNGLQDGEEVVRPGQQPLEEGARVRESEPRP